MYKITDLSLPSAGTQDDVERGELKIEKGEKVMGVRLRVTVPLNNTSGGAVVLSDTQKRALLALFEITEFSYGKAGKFALPFTVVTFQEMRRHQLRCYRSEMEGFNNTVDGLQRSLPNVTTTSVTFELVIPTGKYAAFKGEHRNRYGMGRSQCASTFIRIKRAAGTNQVLAGVVINGSVLIDVLPDLLPCKGDVWNPVPHLRRIDDARINFTVEPDGLPLAIDEVTTVHASSALTNVSLKIDDRYVLKQISLQLALNRVLDADDYPAAALLTGEVTSVYETADGELNFDELPTGIPRFIQEGTRQLATVQLMYTFIPIDEAEKLAGEIRNIAVESRKKDILAISAQRLRGGHLPARLMPYAGMVLVDRDEDEFEKFPGLFSAVNAPGVTAAPIIPVGLLSDAQSRFAAHKGAKEDKAANSIVDELVSSIPGAVQSGRGFAKGNTATRALIEARHFR